MEALVDRAKGQSACVPDKGLKAIKFRLPQGVEPDSQLARMAPDEFLSTRGQACLPSASKPGNPPSPTTAIASLCLAAIQKSATDPSAQRFSSDFDIFAYPIDRERSSVDVPCFGNILVRPCKTTSGQITCLAKILLTSNQ